MKGVANGPHAMHRARQILCRGCNQPCTPLARNMCGTCYHAARTVARKAGTWTPTANGQRFVDSPASLPVRTSWTYTNDAGEAELIQRQVEQDFLDLNIASLQTSENSLDQLKALLLASAAINFSVKQEILAAQSIESILAALRGKSG